MPATPHPLGETSTPRDDDVRWVEPIFVEPVAASSPPPPREPARWRDVRWVEFGVGEPSARDEEAQLWFVSRVQPAAPRPEPELVEPTFAYLPDEPDDDRGGDSETIAVYLSDSYEYEYRDETAADEAAVYIEEFGTGYAEEELETALYIPEEDGSLDLYAPQDERSVRPARRPSVSSRLWRFAAIAQGNLQDRFQSYSRSRSGGLSPVTIAVGVLAALVALSYYGGEHLAGLAGAMTRPQAPVESAASVAGIAPRSPQPLDPAPAPAPAPLDEAAARATSYLDKAKAGDMVAQYNVAVLYASGKGLAQDFTSAAAWFAKAADAGSASAQFNLGVMYQRGLGVRADAGEAFRWYRRAADRHYAPAEYNLAVAYADGQGTPPDPVAAARWYHQAAAQGLVPAMINFAIQYEKGEGVEHSPVDAYAWYRAAAQRGDAIAEKRAGELLAQFDANKKRSAQAQSALVAGMIRQSAPEMTPLPTATGNDVGAAIANSGD